MKQFFLLVFLGAGIASSAQKVSGKLVFPKGKKLEMVSDVKSTISQEMMGQSMDINLNSSTTRVFNIEDVKGGNATIEHKVKHIMFNVDAMGQGQSFDSDKEEDRKSDMGKNLEKVLKSKYKMTVDANGKVTAVKADENNVADSNAEATNDMMSQLGADLSVPKVGDASAFKILPDKEVSKGETWVDSTSKKTPEMAVKSTYTVSNITDSDVVVDFTDETKVTKTQETMGAEANIVMNMKTTGKITLDKKTGLMKQKTSSTEGTGSVDILGQSIPMTTKATETVTVKQAM